MNWERLFNRTILNRGYHYYRNAGVLDLTETGDRYEAHVQGSGSMIYAVSVDLTDPYLPVMKCSCPFARGGQVCKHMAAVMYRIEAQYPWAFGTGYPESDTEEEDSSEKLINPFLDQAESSSLLEDIPGLSEDIGTEIPENKNSLPAYRESYNYYDLSSITGRYRFSSADYNTAREMVREGFVTLASVTFGYSSDPRQTGLIGKAEGYYTVPHSGANYSIRIRFSDKEILENSCSVPGCPGNMASPEFWRRSVGRSIFLCTHEIALLLLLQEYLDRNHPGDATSENASELLERYRKMGTSAFENESEAFSADQISHDVKLIPRLRHGYRNLCLDFKVGVDRQYVVKNIGSFIRAVREKERMPVGKNNYIDFAAHTFDDQSAKYYTMILNARIDEAERIGSTGDSYWKQDSEGESIFPLFGSRLDTLFDIADSTVIPYIPDYGKEKNPSIRFAEEPYTLPLTIRSKNDVSNRFQGITVNGTAPALFRGVQYTYVIKHISEGIYRFCRISNENAEAIFPIADTLKGGSMTVGRKNLSTFYYKVLPSIEKYTDVTEHDTETIEKYLPPKAVFRFYLDASEDEITCMVTAGYDKETIILTPERHQIETPEMYRDTDTETALIGYILTLFPEYNYDQRLFSTERSDDAVYSILDGGVRRLMDFGEVHTTSRFDNLHIRRKWNMTFGVAIDSDIMTLEILTEDFSPEELYDILKSYKRRKKFHRLKNGDFVDLRNENVAALESVMESLHLDPKEFVKGKMHIPVYRALYLDKMLEEHEEISANRDDHFRNLIRNFKTSRDSDYQLPSSLKKIMRGYQKNGFKWLLTVSRSGFGGILADDMGLGKTLQMISVLLYEKEHEEIIVDERKQPAGVVTAHISDMKEDIPAHFSDVAEDSPAHITDNAENTPAHITDNAENTPAYITDTVKLSEDSHPIEEEDVGNTGNAIRSSSRTSLVVCPSSLIYNWFDEFTRFAPALRVCPVAGSKDMRKDILHRYEDYDVLITSYDLLKRDIDIYESLTFYYNILDEAQYIKNPASAAAKSVKILHSRHRFALTGTPIENRLSELWSIFDFLMPGFLYPYDTFRRELETPITKNRDEAASERLRKMTSPFILRRLKSDVLKDLPEKLEETRFAQFEESQRKLYDAHVARMKKMLESSSDENFSRNKIEILAELTRLRQICCDPSLLVENYVGGSAKREALITLINTAIDGGHRLLVFSQFTTMLSLIEADLKACGIEYYLITGQTPKEERLRLVKRFNSGDVPVFLISLKAGGTGLNLVGADVVVHYDPWWNLAVQNQATDRAHRIGQKNVVNVYKLIARGTIEEKIQHMQEQKKDLADEILRGEGGTLQAMTREDLMDLLS